VPAAAPAGAKQGGLSRPARCKKLTPTGRGLCTARGQVTIPKHIRDAAGVPPGSDVSFSLEGSKIVITPVGSGFKEDCRAKLREAAAKVHGSYNAQLRQLGTDEIMNFIRGDEPTNTSTCRGTH
jgi:AbrB family looped-hinge helix DNA binding protein